MANLTKLKAEGGTSGKNWITKVLPSINEKDEEG